MPVPTALAQLIERYLVLLQKWNQRINLTALEDPLQVLRTLFAESFYAATLLETNDSPVLDVGSGAGFPGMAMKLYQPELEVILLEPRQKRAAFLAAVGRELGLSGLSVWSRSLQACRARDFARPPVVLALRGLAAPERLIRLGGARLGCSPAVLLFVSTRQVEPIREELTEYRWKESLIPWNPGHVILLGRPADVSRGT